MESAARQGRPRASSRETLAEAACELFLEQGYDATSVSDITARAGVSRSSFFNYFGSKADVLWSGVDDSIAELASALQQPSADVTAVRTALGSFAAGLRPDALALGIANAGAMGIEQDLARESAARASTMAQAITASLRNGGMAPLQADVYGRAYAGAVFAAVERWALDGSGRTSLDLRVAEAVALVEGMPSA